MLDLDDRIARSVLGRIDQLRPGDAYAGIGSRSAEKEVLDLLEAIAYRLASRDVICRSGGADGCDSAFEAGALQGGGSRAFEGFAPWKGFNGRPWDVHIPPGARRLVEQFHPNASRLSHGAFKLMMRNCQQVLGANLDTPSKLIICWTSDGADGVDVLTTSKTGGTGFAIRLGSALGIPVVNLGGYAVAPQLKMT